MAQKRVAVIGAGPSGLTAIKCLKEAGIKVLCYERCGVPGGLWRFHEDDIEGVASVMRTTIINTSKEMSAFSDFPPDPSYPNYMHNRQMNQYFTQYAEHFQLLSHIRYHLEVVKVEQTPDFDTTGRWIVTVRSTMTAATSKEEFDGVLVCVGHHVFPKIPTFPQQEKFQGTIIHTHSLKNCDQFAGQRVVVVGIGNSGVDAAVDCTYGAEQVYLSTRRGSWIFSRVCINGRPFDIDFSTRKNVFLSRFMSYNALCNKIENDLNSKFDHEAYSLKPKHRALSAHPTLNDNLPNVILSGRVVVKKDIERFEEKGVVFEGEDEVTEIDAVILATGYHIKFPFLDPNLIQTEDNVLQLYKYAIPPSLTKPTLALIGCIQPLGAIFPISELQCRWFARLMTGDVQLPSPDDMAKDVAYKNKLNAKRYVSSTRHTVQVDWVPFMDEIASLFGAKPNLLKMAVTDPKLFWACFNGPCVPYQYRLQGPNPWSGARQAILDVDERIFTPLNENGKKIYPDSKSNKGWFFVLALTVIVGCTLKRNFLLNNLDISARFR